MNVFFDLLLKEPFSDEKRERALKTTNYQLIPIAIEPIVGRITDSR
jgi:hypothetical protein